MSLVICIVILGSYVHHSNNTRRHSVIKISYPVGGLNILDPIYSIAETQDQTSSMVNLETNENGQTGLTRDMNIMVNKEMKQLKVKKN